jgi:hypothetical protein
VDEEEEGELDEEGESGVGGEKKERWIVALGS